MGIYVNIQKNLENWNCTIFISISAQYLTLSRYSFFPSKYILLIVLSQLSHYSPLFLLHPLLPALPLLSSCPWVVHISSLTSLFPILFLTSPCPLRANHLSCYSLCLFRHSPPSPPPPLITLPCDLHFCDSVPVQLFA